MILRSYNDFVLLKKIIQNIVLIIQKAIDQLIFKKF